jgi:hypothetical protein
MSGEGISIFDRRPWVWIIPSYESCRSGSRLNHDEYSVILGGPRGREVAAGTLDACRAALCLMERRQ